MEVCLVQWIMYCYVYLINNIPFLLTVNPSKVGLDLLHQCLAHE